MRINIFSVILMLVFAMSGPAYSAAECFEKSENYEDGKKVGGLYDKEGRVEKGYKETEDNVKELLFCNLQLAYEGPHTLFKNCGCRATVKKSCSFSWKDGDLVASGKNGATEAMCVPWKPIANLL